jgi:hypothetical protein
MARVHETEVERPEGSDPTRRVRLLSAVVAAPALSTVVVITATGTDAPVGAPPYWPGLLTSLQVLALWSAGTRRWCGWLLGGAVQLPLIASAVITEQLRFIPGCAVSAIVRIHSFMADGSDRGGAGSGTLDVQLYAGRRR